jgi:hypothetical protein
MTGINQEVNNRRKIVCRAVSVDKRPVVSYISHLFKQNPSELSSILGILRTTQLF